MLLSVLYKGRKLRLTVLSFLHTWVCFHASVCLFTDVCWTKFYVTFYELMLKKIFAIFNSVSAAISIWLSYSCLEIELTKATEISPADQPPPLLPWTLTLPPPGYSLIIPCSLAQGVSTGIGKVETCAVVFFFVVEKIIVNTKKA
jgi:hypothetical protein